MASPPHGPGHLATRPGVNVGPSRLPLLPPVRGRPRSPHGARGRRRWPPSGVRQRDGSPREPQTVPGTPHPNTYPNNQSSNLTTRQPTIIHPSPYPPSHPSTLTYLLCSSSRSYLLHCLCSCVPACRSPSIPLPLLLCPAVSVPSRLTTPHAPAADPLPATRARCPRFPLRLRGLLLPCLRIRTRSAYRPQAFRASTWGPIARARS